MKGRDGQQRQTIITMTDDALIVMFGRRSGGWCLMFESRSLNLPADLALKFAKPRVSQSSTNHARQNLSGF